MSVARLTTCVMLCSLLSALAAVRAEVYEIHPQNADAGCNELFESRANELQPGDELVLHDGVYSQSCRRAITAVGTAAQPIVIRAAAGAAPLLTRPAANLDTQNNFEVLNSAYLVIRGLRFHGGSAGVRFRGGHHITFEDNEVAYTGGTGITLNQGDTHAFTIRRNHVHHTGLSDGRTEGEGLYVGCQDASCIATDHLIEDNYIHDLRGTSGGGNDGIEIKAGSGGNTIRRNRIHDTNIGREYPCIFVYGGGSAPNVVDSNFVYHCGEGIQVVSDAVIVNNVIGPSSATGITAAPHAVVDGIANVLIVNNTVYGQPECLYVRWAGAVNVSLFNNAFYCAGATALNASGWSATTAIGANRVAGNVQGAGAFSAGFLPGGTAAATFIDAAGGDFRLAPGSSLIDSGFATAPGLPSHDHAGLPRILGASVDVGAFEFDLDYDGIDTDSDNCIRVANPDQHDSNNDGIGNACDADIAPATNDCLVNFVDLAAIKAAFFSNSSRPDWNADADFNNDGRVDFSDLAALRANFLLDYRVDNPSGIPNDCTPRL